MQTLEIDLNLLDFPLVIRPDVPLTDEELLCFSSRNTNLRIERTSKDEITIMTPVTGKANRNEGYVFRIFSTWAEEDGHGVDFSSTAGFNLSDGATLSPDVAWVRLSRWNALTPEQQDTFVPFSPDFLIEVRSKSDRRKTVEEKMLRWMQNGAQLAWLVDPIDATVTIYRPNADPETLLRPASVTAGDPVAGFTLPCTRLWPTD